MSELENENEHEYNKCDHIIQCIEDHRQSSNLSGYWLKIAGTATVVLVTIIISMTSFWMMIGKDFVTRDEARIIIEREIEPIDKNLDSYKSILVKNTDAIIDLKLSLSSLGSIDAMEKRISYLETEIRMVREEQLRRTNSLEYIDEIRSEIKGMKDTISEIKDEIRKRNQNEN